MFTTILLPLFLLFPPLQNLLHAFPREGAKQLIDNQRVTVWEVTLEKGKPAPLHEHKYDMVSVELADATLRNIDANNRGHNSAVRVGQVIWNARGLTHGEELIGDTPRRKSWSKALRERSSLS